MLIRVFAQPFLYIDVDDGVLINDERLSFKLSIVKHRNSKYDDANQNIIQSSLLGTMATFFFQDV